MLIVLPYLVWMIQHHFPHLEMLANMRRSQINVSLDPLGFLSQQVLLQQPFTLPLWLAGLVYFFVHPQGKTHRYLGWAYLLALVILLVINGRVYYLSPTFPMLLAGGAVWAEEWLRRPRLIWIKPAFLAILAVSGTVLAPLALPVLPPETYVRYSTLIGINQPRLENSTQGVLPQPFADRFGWPGMAQATARVYHSLSPAEQAGTVILGAWYGPAGAVDFYGPGLGLPKALSGHLTYYYWGEQAAKNVKAGATVIALGFQEDNLEGICESVEVAGSTYNPYTMPRNNFPILLCRGLKFPLSEIWPHFKYWD